MIPETHRREAYHLLVLAAASLYLELALIRWTAAEVLYLGYFSNFILITAFLGLGLGFLAARREVALHRFVPLMLLFLHALVLVSRIDASVLRNRFGLFSFGNMAGQSGLPGGLLLVVLFLATLLLFAGVGQLVGRAFAAFSPLRAYTLDILGSLAGTALFSLQCLTEAGPLAWIVTGGLLLVVGNLLDESGGGVPRAVHVAVAAACVVLVLLSARPPHPVIWSTYQKLELRPPSRYGKHDLYANGIFHQVLSWAKLEERNYYGYPYYLHWQAAGGAPRRVLVVGAGTGTDVAVGLRHKVAAIDAVEIDPGIVQLAAFHPDRPYEDPRVTVHVADGREYLRNTTARYDLIIFALPDSLIKLSSMSSVRLESYLFTLECFEDVKAHLREKGTFVMYNQYRWPWLVNKLGASLQQVFGHPPLVTRMGETTVLGIGANLKGPAQEWTGFTRLATDDWPFIYLQRPQIHWLYMGMIGTFLLVAFAGVLLLAPRGTLRRPDWPFFAMGAAFLLLETKSISFFSLQFGTTWLVNSLAFTGVLLSVLAANLLVQRYRLGRRVVLFGALFGALALAYLIPAAWLLGIASPPLRYALSVLLVFSPIFFANLIFSREFRDVDQASRAFGWNLLGAVAGGGLEYLSLVTGQRNLLLLGALCYAVVALLLGRERRRAA